MGALAAAPAHARQIYPAYGGPGDANAMFECPKGHYVVGFGGRVGEWVDQIAVLCAALQPDGSLVRDATNQVFGGAGGSISEITCPEGTFVQTIGLIMTKDARQLYKVFATCTDAHGGRRSDMVFGGQAPGGSAGMVGDDPLPTSNQPCRPGEALVGAQFNYGKHVNAFGAICDLVLTTVAQAPPPPPAPPGVIKHTGPSNRAPDPARWDDWVGVWDVTTSQNGGFRFTFTRDGDTLVGKFEAPGQPQFNGTTKERGTSPGMVLMFTYEQPGIHGSGSGGFVLSTDGKTIRGNATTNDNPPVKITWTGHKVSASTDDPK